MRGLRSGILCWELVLRAPRIRAQVEFAKLRGSKGSEAKLRLIFFAGLDLVSTLSLGGRKLSLRFRFRVYVLVVSCYH